MNRLLPLAILLTLAGSGWAGVEEERIAKARARLGDVVERYADVVELAGSVSSAADLPDLGTRLWRRAATDNSSNGQGDHPDDRSLYWSRLAIRQRLQDVHPELPLGRFEWTSRGFDDVRFPEGGFQVLVSGFDPFLLDEHIEQSNPSGVAALLLDGATLETPRGIAHVQAVMMPVRFGDFDEGLVEAVFRPWLESGGLDLAVTISMGRAGAFHLERFPGRRRSASVPDNRNVLTGASATEPKVPRLGDRMLEGPEFVEFSLPAAGMAAVSGRWPVHDNRSVATLERGALTAASLGSLAGQTAVSGSGGGYLSNEISYRTVLLSRQLGSRVPIGHLHTPRVEGYDGPAEAEIVDQIRAVLVAGIASLAD